MRFCFSYFEAVFEPAGLYYIECCWCCLDSDKYNFLPKMEHILNVSYFGESKDYK